MQAKISESKHWFSSINHSNIMRWYHGISLEKFAEVWPQGMILLDGRCYPSLYALYGSWNKKKRCSIKFWHDIESLFYFRIMLARCWTSLLLASRPFPSSFGCWIVNISSREALRCRQNTETNMHVCCIQSAGEYGTKQKRELKKEIHRTAPFYPGCWQVFSSKNQSVPILDRNSHPALV